MSTISAVGSASSAWSDLSSLRASAMKEKMFAKVDSDSSGSVDKTELQGMLDHMAKMTGNSLGSADDLMTKMDADGNGSLSSDELDSGMKSLMPPPSSTVDFAQQREGGPGSPGGCGGPPPPDASDSDSTSSSADPLDTNGDGTVSAQERMAGELKASLKDLLSAIDSDGDKKISKSEAETFKANLDTALSSLDSSGSSDSASSDTSSSTPSREQD
jgi:Ca2+-binding EF-hand superfamily protein